MSNSNTQAKGLIVLSAAIDNAFNELTIHELKRIKYRIDVHEIIPPPQIAWSLSNTKTGSYAILGTLGNFSLIIGKAKAKKSFFINIAVSTALSKVVILDRFKSDLPKEQSEVLYFDTEQSKYHVQLAIKRICKQINEPEPKNLCAYYLRTLKPSERLQFIETEIYKNGKIGFVVIDGIRDLITSINDEEQATMITSKLLKWTEERNIHILTVLHQNKNDNNARGHIGTELINKAETVLEVAPAKNNSRISIITAVQCRNLEPDTFAFEINDEGIPIVAENFESSTKTGEISTYDTDDAIYHLLKEVFVGNLQFGYKKLVAILKVTLKNQLKKEFGENTIKKFITHCKTRGWLIQDKLRGPYKLAPM